MRSILIYAGILALASLALQWIEYQYLAKVFVTEVYIILLVVAFTGLGVWLGVQLTPQAKSGDFQINDAALRSLGITAREYAVLAEISGGHSNKEIAQVLNVSPNTVKTHIAHLYEKLQVGRRVQAVQKARDLRLIP